MRVDADVADVARRSRVVRAALSAVGRVRFDARRSSIAGAISGCRAATRTLAPAERVRCAGVIAIGTAASHALLLQWSPDVARPGASAVWSITLGAVGLVMMLLAEPVARAWTSSRLRRFLLGAPAAERRASERS